MLETAATGIAAYEAQQVPGLLQTPAYARALAEADPFLADDAARDRAAEAVIARQQAILGERRPDVHLIIGQAALHQQVGSAEVMDEQLDVAGPDRRREQRHGHRAGAAVRVRRARGGGRRVAGRLGVRRSDRAWGSCTWAGSAAGYAWRAEDDLAAYTEAFDQLRAFALSPAQSALLLRGTARRLTASRLVLRREGHGGDSSRPAAGRRSRRDRT